MNPAASVTSSYPLRCSGIPGSCSKRLCGRLPSRPLRLRVQAAGEPKGEPDLSQQFAEFKKRMQASMPEVESRRVTTQPPRFTSQRSWNSGPSADQLRRQERQALDAWTQERLMQLAAGGTMLLVLLLLFAAGGPPSDARCTLPWC